MILLIGAVFHTIYNAYLFLSANFTIHIMERDGLIGKSPETEMQIRVLQSLFFSKRKIYKLLNEE